MTTPLPKPIRRNIKGLEDILEKTKTRLTTSTKGKIRDVIQLYKDRRIAQFTTAQNMVLQLIRVKTAEDKQKANTKYQNMMEQYDEKKH